MKTFKISLLIVSLLIVGWISLYLQAPKINARFTKILISEPSKDKLKWKHFYPGIRIDGCKQVEFVFEVRSNHRKTINVFGIYSRRLDKYALAKIDINSEFNYLLYSKAKNTVSLIYLIRDKDIKTFETINPENEFIAYASFSDQYTWEDVEKSFLKNRFLAPIFGVGFSHIRNKSKSNI